eukprot:TRINITY_DN8104_c0_g1_i1.p1 TRINITY_DN8104_c0_g1~~TRINITY_DN8104_c0_g1_i1.p1  ORF type:complete len:536 (+),score=110.23 TRINITY_DN8104_c0_g1_i1:86-1693(+)
MGRGLPAGTLLALLGGTAGLRREGGDLAQHDDAPPRIEGNCPGVPVDVADLAPGHALHHARPGNVPRVLPKDDQWTGCWEENMGCHSCCGGEAFGCPKLKTAEFDFVWPHLGLKKVKGGFKSLTGGQKSGAVHMFWGKVTQNGWMRMHGKTWTGMIRANAVGKRRQPHLRLRDGWLAVALKGWGGYAEQGNWDDTSDCQRWEERVVVVLPASWLLKGFSQGKWANVGHWLAEVFAPVLHALLTLGETAGLVLLLKRTSSSLLPQDAAWESAWPYQAAALGLPWMQHLAPPVSLANNTCLRRITVACPPNACPTAKYIHQQMPSIRRWLAARYGLTFARRPAPQRPALTICTRRPGGSRFIDNAAQLSARAESLGWRVGVMPHFGGQPMARWLPALQQGDAFAAFHGADLILPLTLLRQGSVAIEIIPSASFSRDPWYTFMAAGAGVSLLRWIVPPALLRFDIEGSIAHDKAEWDKVGRADGGDRAHNVRAENASAVYDGLQWRRLISNATLPVDLWAETLAVARGVLAAGALRAG